ncbi:MAG: hypothetical protein ACTSRZ_05850 [Promethearchaeota archaeon]
MTSNNYDSNNLRTQVLTVRIPTELKERLQNVSRFKLRSRMSQTVINYLKISEILIVREDSTKFSWDNSDLAILPIKFILKLFEQVNKKLNDDEKFAFWAQFGDESGQFLNDIFSIIGIPQKDYLKMFEIIKKFGWFNYTLEKIDNNSAIIKIPKNFAPKPYIYALIHRIVYKVRYPGTWNKNVIDGKYPGDAEKDKKEAKKWRDNYYIKDVKNLLGIEEDKQNNSQFYYFNVLKVNL